ncbi:extracellular solute-binding protein [Kribbella sp. NBC_00709]|uniref:ABC transporter substrate-binding protein n=1 Tax=Kribbella sp. NBC_00709 TaxID=2975972 RepID=UPI002E288397|nr:extracellular solute-binding protein [Kribbella sp. NBC_00709]
MNFTRSQRPAVWCAALCSLALVVSACGGGGGSASGSDVKDGKALSVLVTTENTSVPAELKSLANGKCKTEATALPLDIQQSPSADIQQKIQLLAGQDALPSLFAAGNSFIDKGGDLQKNGQVLDLDKALTDLGVNDKITPAAKSTLQQLYSGTIPSLPFQYNIEGIWYNKKIFAEQHIAVPTTWGELLAAADKLKAAGITPFTASGGTSWTISRWVGAYLFRSLGTNAMLDVKEHKTKLTDPQYVAAAQAIQDLGSKKYFTDGISGIDYDTANNQFLTGKAAMMYMGSWLLALVNDPSKNKIGDAVGLMPFPAVEGGKGDINAYPANTGAPTSVNPKLFGPKTQAWVKCIATNYASDSMEQSGTFSGFVMDHPVKNIPPLTADVQQRIDKSTSTVLWFEALFNNKANQDAGAYVVKLLTGSMSAADYMGLLQKDLDTAQ